MDRGGPFISGWLTALLGAALCMSGLARMKTSDLAYLPLSVKVCKILNKNMELCHQKLRQCCVIRSFASGHISSYVRGWRKHEGVITFLYIAVQVTE